MRWFVAALVLSTIPACKNSCQNLCVNMQVVAQECGYNVSEAEVDQCITDQKTAEKEQKDACTAFGSEDAIRTEWSCEELGAYWGG